MAFAPKNPLTPVPAYAAQPIELPDAIAESSPMAERDALYRDNQARREHPVQLERGSWDESTPVSVLGLEQTTISRLYRVGIVRLVSLLETSVEDLWRSIGRQGITDIMRCLQFHGLSLRPLNDYERWRLGLIEPDHIAIAVTASSPLAALWPKLGVTLVEVLQKRGRFSVSDLAPRNQDELLQLYRLGKSNLAKIQAALEQLAPRAEGPWRERIERGLRLMAACSKRRRSRRSLGARSLERAIEPGPSSAS